MDSRLREKIAQYKGVIPSYEESVLVGFKLAIERIRQNNFYGYQGEFVADWLEKHLTQEVTSDRSKDK